MGVEFVTEEGWDVAVEPTRNGRVELLIVRECGLKGGTLFFDRANAGLLADAIARAIEDGPQESNRGQTAVLIPSRRTRRIVTLEGWEATVFLNAENVLRLCLAECGIGGTTGNFLSISRPNAALLCERLRG